MPSKKLIMTILTEYSLWFIPLCLLVGVVFAVILYFRNKNIEYGKRTNWIMAVLRGLSISLITFLLLSPLLKMSTKEIDKPIIVFAIDNSESMVSTADSSFYRNGFQQQINQLIGAFGDDYDVKTYLIGNQNALLESNQDLKVPFGDKTTNLSSIFDEMSDLYANRNVGAMVLISDGIYNAGFNPQYKVAGLQFPIHTVGAGNTELQTDLSIAGITHNKQTYLGNFFPVEIKISAGRLASQKAKLTVFDKENEVFSKEIRINGNQYFETVKFSLEAKAKGTHKYRVTLSELDGEITYKNNSSAFFIEVVDSREKIAIVYSAPHPDVSAIKQALMLSDKYQVDVFSIDEFKKNPNDYSLFILHQLPSRTKSSGSLLTQIQQNHLSALYILGPQSDLNSFNKMNTGLSLTQSMNLFNESTPVFNDNFLLFTFSEEARQMLNYYTPLTTFFGSYQTTGSANSFLYQEFNKYTSNYPLIMFSQNNNSKTGVITGEGIWRWRMQNYLQTQNFDAFDEIVNKMALYLSVKGDKSFFRVYAKEVFPENQPIELTAELYNESYELISEPDVNFTLTDSEGKKYTSLFSKQNNSYYLDLGKLPVGDYQWEATTQAGNNAYRKSGHFTVEAVIVESLNLVANHDLLQTIASTSNGKFFTMNDMQKIEKVIKDNENIKPIATYNKKYNLILNSWIYLAAIFLLLGIEWFIRKWGGGY